MDKSLDDYYDDLCVISNELSLLETGFGCFINKHGIIDFKKSDSNGVSGLFDRIDVFFNKNVWKLKNEEKIAYQFRVNAILCEVRKHYGEQEAVDLLWKLSGGM
jgi:hypothetical protein